EPDEALVETVLVKLFIDRQLDAGEEVVRFLMARMPRSVTAARHVAAAIDRAALTARRRQITLPLARAALHELEANEAEDSIEGV
ncbi:MAG TPA: DNA replication protein, partial [Kiloniellaceae bacterium]